MRAESESPVVRVLGLLLAPFVLLWDVGRRLLFGMFSIAERLDLIDPLMALSDTTNTPTARLQPLEVPAVPSFIPLWLMTAVAVGALAIIRRRVADRLVFWAWAAFASGGLILGFMTLPMVRIGAEGLQQPPTIEGYELVNLDRHFWPDLHAKRLATLTYRPTDGTDPLKFNPNDRSALGASNGIGFGRNHCREYRSQRTDVGRDIDEFCVESATAERLTVTVGSSRGPDRMLARLVGFPLMTLGLVYALLAAARVRRQSPWSTARDLVYGLGLVCLIAAVFFSGFFAWAIVSSTAADLSGINADAGDFHQQVWERLDTADVHGPAAWVYLFLILAADALAVVAAVVGWILATASFKGGARQRSKRLWICVAMTLLIVVALALQIGFYQSVSILDWYNE